MGVEVNNADVSFDMNIGEPGDVRIYNAVVADMAVLLHNRRATSLPNSERAKEGAS
jgi:hypothetical protein